MPTGCNAQRLGQMLRLRLPLLPRRRCLLLLPRRQLSCLLRLPASSLVLPPLPALLHCGCRIREELSHRSVQLACTAVAGAGDACPAPVVGCTQRQEVGQGGGEDGAQQQAACSGSRKREHTCSW